MRTRSGRRMVSTFCLRAIARARSISGRFPFKTERRQATHRLSGLTSEMSTPSACTAAPTTTGVPNRALNTSTSPTLRRGATAKAVLPALRNVLSGPDQRGRRMGNRSVSRGIIPGSENRYDVVVHSLETGDERIYRTNLGTSGYGGPGWSQDGKTIVTGIGSETAGALYRINLGTGDFQLLPIAAMPPAYFPGWETLYTARNAEKDSAKLRAHIGAVDLSTGQEKEIFTMPDPGNFGFFLTTDGRTFVIRRAGFENANDTFLSTKCGRHGISRGLYHRPKGFQRQLYSNQRRPLDSSCETASRRRP